MYETYSQGPAGAIKIELDVFDQYWQRDGASNLLIWTEEPQQQVLRRLQKVVGDRQALFFTQLDQMRGFVQKKIDEASLPLYSLLGLIAGLGGLALLNLQLGAVRDWARDLGIYRSAGATRFQLVLLIFLDGIIVSTIGLLAGLGLGFACSAAMLGILEETFNWTMRFAFNPLEIIALVAGVLTLTTFAAWQPGLRAREISPAEVLARDL